MLMKRNFLLLLSLILFLSASSQEFSGQWKGEFIDKSTSFRGFGGDECDYVLELECKGNEVSGSSYTYFTDGGRKYYTICKLQGFIKPGQKYVEIREVERTKTNVPVTIRNCFQVHKLTFFKHGDSTSLEGNWVPAPNQQGDCGYGTTLLTRRELKNSFPKFNNTTAKGSPVKKKIISAPATNPTATTKAKTTIVTKPLAKTTTPAVKKVIPVTSAPVAKTPVIKKPKTKTIPLAAQSKKDLIKKDDSPKADPLVANTASEVPETIIQPQTKFEKRSTTVLQTIQVKNKTVNVDLYDNGEVDGDSISLFYNGKLLLAGKRLSEKPISLTITVEDDVVNELVMYAENLGTIPPNTALMIVTDGPKRYEVRITSDLQKSGVIDFVHKPGS